MKLIGIIILALAISGCTSTQSISFSPSQEYSVSIESSLFNAVRNDENDITLFQNGKAAGFVRTEPVPENVNSAREFLKALQAATESNVVHTKQLSTPAGFTGFSVANRNYLTGYLMSEGNPESILIISFPEDDFDEIVETVSAGI